MGGSLIDGHLFRALRSRNFRYFFAGQLLSVSGTWMQRVAQSWLAYRLTGSSFYLGLVAFAGSAPAFLLAPIGGILADRWDRRTLLIRAQTLSLLTAALLAYFTLAGTITPALLLVLSIVQGVVNAFENPARQSFYTEMVPQEHLSNAIALNASLVNLARVTGPALAGIIVVVWGEGVCFALNAFSFVAVIWALFRMRVQLAPRTPSKQRGWELFREGIAFVSATPSLRRMLTNFSIFNLAGSPYQTLLPLLAVETLHTGPGGLGWLVSASGIGAVTASLALAARRTTEGLPRATFLATAVAGLALIVLALSPYILLSAVMMALIGAGYVFALAGTQTMMQASVPEAMRGRVMGFYSMLFLGVPPIGSLIAGVAAEKMRTPATVLIGGLTCLVFALRFAAKTSTHPEQESLPTHL